ncbi:MAG: hypothetical protein KAJ07_10585 [Planctomycetes bacterium]|nr:hypothetical protein [Planctomycetota bacterium]
MNYSDAMVMALLRVLRSDDDEQEYVSFRSMQVRLDEDGWTFSIHSLRTMCVKMEIKGMVIIQKYKGMDFPQQTVIITDAGLSKLYLMESAL